MDPLPPVKNRRRRNRAMKSFIFFCEAYFKGTFFRPFQDVHRHIIAEGERKVRDGGKQIILAPRGCGKTAILRALLLWSILCFPKQHKYVLYIAAIERATAGTHKWLLAQFFSNDTLAEDFPEVCLPFRAHGSQKDHQKRITYGGEPVMTSWTNGVIVLPTIEDSPYCGITIGFRSISSGAILGTDATIAGIAYRPSLVACDDLQSPDTAKSPAMVESMWEVVSQSLADLAGYDRETGKPLDISIIAVMTARHEGDLAMTMFGSPDFHGIRHKRLDPMPSRMDLWERYRVLRNESTESASRFYEERRAEMDDGCRTIDDTHFSKSFVSAIHAAMDIWATSPQRFYTEQQNDPSAAYQSQSQGLIPDAVVGRAVRMPPLMVPNWAELLTSFVDLGDHYLNWEIVAFGENYRRVQTVAFGWWPDQGTADIDKHHCLFKIETIYEEAGRTVQDQVCAALGDALEMIYELPFVTESGEPFDAHYPSRFRHARTGDVFPILGAIGVDSGSGIHMLSAWAACDAFNRARGQLAIPCNGSTVQRRLFGNIDLDSRIGEWSEGLPQYHRHWIENAGHTMDLRRKYRNAARSLWWDTNIWKTRRNIAWMTALGSDGCHAIAAYPRDWLRRYAEHQCAEHPVNVSMASMREYQRWVYKKPRTSDNEFLDTNTGCWMLADYVGMRDQLESETIVVRNQVSREEIQERIRSRQRKPS